MKWGELKKAMQEARALDDEDVKIIIADGAEHLDELEEGSVLSIEDTGYNAQLRSRVIYVMPS
jgi:hypothetical protein